MISFFSKSLLASVMGSCLLVSCSTTAPPTATPTGEVTRPAFDTFTAPNVQLPVTTAAGTCPDTVDLWVMSQGFEGGADHTVVVDFPAIATGPTEILSSEDRRIIYVAPLQEEFASCSGTAESEFLAMYSVHLGNGKVHFELNLSDDGGARTIRYADLSVTRPYIYWRAES